jgi:membrane-associated phospholipid phosphatase
MERQTVAQPTLQQLSDTLPVPVQAGLGARAAAWISHVASPPLLLCACAVLIAVREGGSAVWLWVVAYGALAALLPMAYIVRQVQLRRATDIHLPRRQERLRPLLLAAASGAVAALLLDATGAPSLLVRFAAATAVQTALVLVITLRWKISMHAAAVTALAVLAWVLYGAPGLWLALLIPVVAWARLRLRRHTPAQVLAGALSGAAVFGLLLTLPATVVEATATYFYYHTDFAYVPF